MRAAVCFDGVESAELVRAARPLLEAFEPLEAWCAYGDVAARELAYVRERHGRQPPHPPHEHEGHGHAAPHGHEPQHAMPDEEQAEAIAEHGAELLRATGLQATPRTLTGRDAGHALVEAAREDVALIVGTGHRPGTGPKSLGHVTRFVVDHALAPVVVLRLLPPDGSRW